MLGDVVVCFQCATENPDVARFCLTCGSLLAEPEPREQERKPVTAVFVDLIRATRTAEELDPEVVQRRLDPYFRRLRVELERFGGTIEKFIGDPVVGLFGAPVARGDDAERAVRAALAVLAAIEELNEEDSSRELAVRVGVNTGEAFVELGARTSEGERMAWGNVVGTAARLQSAAPAGGVLVGEETWRATRRAIEYRDHAPVEAKAKAGRIPAWQAVGVAASAVAERPLVGRQSELVALETLWRQVTTEAHAAFALVVGPPGIGKSRLVAELADRVDGVRVRGRCLPYGEGMTYWPVIEILKQVAGILLSDSPEEVAEKVGALLERLPTDDRDELRTMAAALSNLLVTEWTPRGTYSAGEISRGELHWGLRRVLELSAQERPLLVVLEDLHWAEPTLLELLRFVSEGAAAPVMLLGSARSELEPGMGVGAELRLELEPLGADASEELLRGLLGEAPPELLERADGNPLFLEELAGAVGEDGDASLPTTLQALIGARLDALARPSKRVAQYASVCGTVFWQGAVAELTEEHDVKASLAELERRELIREHAASTIAGEAEWSFKHVLVRDVAYGRLPKALRARLHQRFARWVAAIGNADGFVEIRAWHLEQACRLAREAPPLDEAIAALTAAGERAEQREGIREADRFYTRALELLDPDDTRALGLRFRRARLLAVLADHKAAVAALTPIAEEAGRRGLEKVRADTLVAIVNVESKLGLAEDARQRLSEAADYAERAGDERLAVRAAFELAYIRSWFDGDVEGASEVFRAAAARADRGAEHALSVEARLRLGSILLNAARLVEAEVVLREACSGSCSITASALASRSKSSSAVPTGSFGRVTCTCRSRTSVGSPSVPWNGTSLSWQSTTCRRRSRLPLRPAAGSRSRSTVTSWTRCCGSSASTMRSRCSRSRAAPCPNRTSTPRLHSSSPRGCTRRRPESTAPWSRHSLARLRRSRRSGSTRMRQRHGSPTPARCARPIPRPPPNSSQRRGRPSPASERMPSSPRSTSNWLTPRPESTRR
jgi:class 3 adenylate cyclase/tetratricopeptide (TPR) repeat protein